DNSVDDSGNTTVDDINVGNTDNSVEDSGNTDINVEDNELFNDNVVDSGNAIGNEVIEESIVVEDADVMLP
ncbi:MAG: hypothetical protein JWP90_2223, partial [Mycetocola sp.]|nr:hypothetical protein [Mycetocola sp.]